jgi:hypothetical protein
MVSVVPSRPRLTLALLASVVALLGATGCTNLDAASAAGVSRDDLVSDTAAQLSRAAGLTYTARYHLTEGDIATVTQAQKPARTAYDYPGGRLIETPTATIHCDRGKKGLVCTRTDAAPVTAAPLPGTALVTPEAALAMLNQASFDPEVEAESRDTTIAGRHATCLSLARVDGTPAATFALCVTNEGALASFTATIDGRRIEQALVSYTEKADPAAFATS